MQSSIRGHGKFFFGRANVRRFVGIAMVMAGSVYAQEAVPSTASHSQVQPRYTLGTANQKWTDGVVNWYYNPLNQPANLSTTEVLTAIQLAANRWSGMCYLTFNYMGQTTASPDLSGNIATVDRRNVIGWGTMPPAHSNGGFTTQRWRFDSTLRDVDVLINVARDWTAGELDGVLTQAFGGLIGLDWSSVPASVTFNSPPHDANYRRTLRGDDAQGCAAKYGAAITADADRIFNWAESMFPTLLLPAPAPSGTYNGFRYRYYPAIQSSILTKDGVVFLVGPDGVLQNLGPLSAYFGMAQSSGF